MDHFAKKLGKPEVKISKETMQRLQDFTWPGNVRELEHTIESALITIREEKLKFDLPIISDDLSSDFKSLAEMELDYLLKVLKARNWKIEGADGAAQTIDMHPNTLRNRMNKLGIKRPKP
jgi:DNA-binding NtrC family response regulator